MNLINAALRAGVKSVVRCLKGRRISRLVGLGAIAGLLFLPLSASATNTIIRSDAKTAKQAQDDCNAVMAQYGALCYAASSLYTANWGGYYRENSYTASVYTSPQPYPDTLTVLVYYCEYPNIWGPNHTCQDATPVPRSDPKNNGEPPADCDCGDPKKDSKKSGNPINPASGNKFQRETDIAIAGSPSELSVSRFYNSLLFGAVSYRSHLFGSHWTTRYDATVIAGPQRLVSQCSRRNGDNWFYCVDNPVGGPAASVTRGDNKTYRFTKAGDQWSADNDVNDRLTSQYDTDGQTVLGWTYTTANGDNVEQFDADGRLIKITARSGAAQFLTYSGGATNDTAAARLPASAPMCSNVQAGAALPAGQLLCVTDNWGRQLNFEHDPATLLVSKVIGPDGQQFLYEFDGPSGGCVAGNDPIKCIATNLTKVTYPGGASKTYWYNESTKINNGTACANAQVLGNGFGALNSSLTGIVDENGARFATWKYNCLGEATSSEHALGVEKVTITYNGMAGSSPTNLLSYSMGTPAAPAVSNAYIYYSTINGMARAGNAGNCPECGVTSNATYDANGNVASALDYRSYLTCYNYDLSRNLETAHVEGLPSSAVCSTALTAGTLTAPARKITRQWHPTFRLPSLIAEPLKVTTFQYDSNGNLLTRTEQATSDANGVLGAAATPVGAARVWTFTYNQFGQVLTAKGPRTDVADVTTYTYDGQANLATITDAAGNTRSLNRPGFCRGSIV